MSRKKAALIYLMTAVIILASDLWSKSAVFEMLDCTIERDAENRPYCRPSEIHVIDGWFSFEASINTGAFNGWFNSHTGALAAVSVIAVIFISALAIGPASSPGIMVMALGLLAGGALGNFYDRYFIQGVRDFLKVYRGEYVWPNFNVADSAICIGVGLILLRELFGWGNAKTPASSDPAVSANAPDTASSLQNSAPTDLAAESATSAAPKEE